MFNVPTGQTCGQYAAEFLKSATGYINNPTDTSNCQYCEYSFGQDFYQGLSMDFDYRWRNLGIMCAYVAFNLVMIPIVIRFIRWDRR